MLHVVTAAWLSVCGCWPTKMLIIAPRSERHTVPNNYARGPSQLGDPLPSCSLHRKKILWWGGFPGNGKPPGYAPDRQERTTAELEPAAADW